MSEQQPLLSVIIPVYNVERYLRQCLESVCGQTYRNLEIICVNDGSSDGSLDILKEYQAWDSRIRLINKANEGVSAARNDALDIAQGEWVIGLDSDDWLHPQAYEQAMGLIDDDIDAILFSVQSTSEDGTPGKGAFATRLPDCKKMPCSNSFIATAPPVFWMKLHRRSIIDKFHIRFPVGCLREDEFFHILFLSHARNIATLSARLYFYRGRPGSIINTSSTMQNKTLMFTYTEQVYKHFRETGLMEKRCPILQDFFIHKCYWELMPHKGEVDVKTLATWRQRLAATTERCGMAADPHFVDIIRAMQNPPRPWYQRFGWDALPARHSHSFRILGYPIWRVRHRFGFTRWQLFGITICKRPSRD